MNARHGIHLARFSMLLTAVFTFMMLAAPGSEAATGKTRKLCTKTCKQQKRECTVAFKTQFQAKKVECKAEPTKGERKSCKKTAKEVFKGNKGLCKAAFKEECKLCCVEQEETLGCSVVVCGDGVVRGEEQCDDGNRTDGDGCSADCLNETAFTGGTRTFSLSQDSAFFSSFLQGNSIATPTGTIVFEASAPDENGVADITTVGGPFFAVFNINQLGQQITVCNRIDSCTGKLYCDGGANVDVVVELDSLADGLTCEHLDVCDGILECCDNSCEGVNVGSGNIHVNFTGVNPAVDSGPGAMLITCQQAGGQFPSGTDCTSADYGEIQPNVYTTGESKARVINHCSGNGAPPDVVPEFSSTGANFSCATWTTENSAGAFAFSVPTEEPSNLLTGDGANAGVLDD